MSAFVLSVVMLAAAQSPVSVSHRRVDADDGAPVFGKLVLVALSALEIEFSTVSEVLDPFACTAAVFLDGPWSPFQKILWPGWGRSSTPSK